MNFKLHFYKKVFERIGDRETSLTTVEAFCMEIIYALNHPTVNEFALVTNISSPNAAYKVNNLIKKGYLKKQYGSEQIVLMEGIKMAFDHKNILNPSKICF